jgi:hypothetical protein
MIKPISTVVVKSGSARRHWFQARYEKLGGRSRKLHAKRAGWNGNERKGLS